MKERRYLMATRLQPTVGMRKVAKLENDLLDRIERLVSELTAIRRWDEEHWQTKCPQTSDVLAFRARRTRKDEILSLLINLACQLKVSMNRRPGKNCDSPGYYNRSADISALLSRT